MPEQTLARHLETMSQLRSGKTETSIGFETDKDWHRKAAVASKMAEEQDRSMNGGAENKSQAWNHDQDLTLLAKVEGHLNDADKKKYVYVKDIIWREVMFDDFDEHEVQRRWNSLTSKVRKLRTAKEILEDTKTKVSDQNANRKRKRDDGDSRQPKMPKTAFLLFCEEKRSHFAAKYPTLNSKELMGKLAKKWQKLSDEKKERYKEIYLENRQQYEHDLTQYFVDNNPEEKPPRTAFDIWSEVKSQEIKKSRPDILEKKLNRKLKKYWERLEDKEIWEKKAKMETDKFIRKMKKKFVNKL